MKYKNLLFTAALVVAVSGCSTSKSLSDANNTAEPESEPKISASVSVANDWYFDAPEEDNYYGAATEKTYTELIGDRQPVKEVIVAIIDSGTDVYHEDLKENIWVNADEIRNNDIDDDQNGYVDDIYGWNFIGGEDSSHVDKDTYEITRIYAKLRDRFEGSNPDSLSEKQLKEYEYFQEIKKKFDRRVENNQQSIAQVKQFLQAVDMAKQILKTDSLSKLSQDQLKPSSEDNAYTQQAKQIMNALRANGVTDEDITDAEKYLEYLEGLRDYGLNPEYDPRSIVGDDYKDLEDRFYGNNDVIGPSSEHGTHVAGVVGAVRNNNLGTKGIISPVKLMVLRTVPDGDERDKDVANAIRYAVDNGASIINMSFGKGYSPNKEYVDAAVRHADSSGVLMVSGAGNDGKNIDSTMTYPSKYYATGDSAANYLTVGASGWQADSTLAATFSNYGKRKVDLFAPGVDIYSTYPGNEYKKEDGTSFSAPLCSRSCRHANELFSGTFYPAG